VYDLSLLPDKDLLFDTFRSFVIIDMFLFNLTSALVFDLECDLNCFYVKDLDGYWFVGRSLLLDLILRGWCVGD